MQRLGWFYLALLVGGSLVLGSISFAGAVFAGGVVSLLSLWASQRGVKQFLEALAGASADEGQAPTKWRLVVGFWIRFLLIGLVLLLLIAVAEVNVLGLTLGLSTVVVTVIVTALMAARSYYFGGR
jgi:carbon starvation protein CstA